MIKISPDFPQDLLKNTKLPDLFGISSKAGLWGFLYPTGNALQKSFKKSLEFGQSYPESIQYLIQTVKFKMLDLDKLDPDWKFAQNHGKACSPGFLKDYSPGTITSLKTMNALLKADKNTFCKCCLRVIDKSPIALCENTKQLEFLGFGFPLYFIFNKYSIILLILQVISYSALSLYWATQSTYKMCELGQPHEIPGGHEGYCNSWLIKFMRAQTVVEDEEIILRICSFFVQLLGLIYIRDTIHKTLQYYEERNTLISDYTIIFMNLPKEEGSVSKIRYFLEEGFEGRKFDIQEIIILNSLEDFFELKEQKLELIKKKKDWVNKPDCREKERRLNELDRKILEREDLMKEEHQKEMEKVKGDTAICDKAVVILSSEDQKNEVIDKFQKMENYIILQHFGVEGLNIQVERAPEPKEIIWQNINYPNGHRIARLMFGWFLTFVLLAVVTSIFYFIFNAKAKAVDHMSNEMATGVTILSMVLITFFNKFILSFLLHHITDLEMHRTGSEYQFSFGLKYTLGLFFTTALMTVIVQGYGLHNVYSEKYGIVEEESMMFFFNAFLIPIIWLVHPWQLFHLLKRRYYYGRKDLTQAEANILMENSRYSVGKKYAEVTESVWFTYLYSSLIPGGAVLITIGFGFFYWIDKCVLLRRSSINPNVNGELSTRSIKLLDVTLVMRCAGQLIFDNLIRESSTWYSVICLGISIIYCLLPTDRILEFFHKEEFKAQDKLYRNVKHNFLENYVTLNPLFTEEMEKVLKKPEIQKKIVELDFHLMTNGKEEIIRGSRDSLSELDFS